MNVAPAEARAALARLLVGAVVISFSAVFVKMVDVAPTVSAFYRTLVGAAILIAVLAWRGEPLRMSRRAFVLLAIAAALFALDLAIWHRSIVLIGPGLATLLGNFQVFVLAFAGVFFFGERLRWQIAVAIPLAFLGVVLIVGFDWRTLPQSDRTGIVLGLFTALLYSSYLLTLRQARTAAPPRSTRADLMIVSVFSATLLGSGALVTGDSLFVHSARDAGTLVAYGVMGQVLGSVLIASALPFVPAARVGLVLLLQPTLSFVWDVWFFDRAMGGRQIMGAGLALAAIFLGSRQDVATRPGLAVEQPDGKV